MKGNLIKCYDMEVKVDIPKELKFLRSENSMLMEKNSVLLNSHNLLLKEKEFFRVATIVLGGMICLYGVIAVIKHIREENDEEERKR